VNDFQSKDFWEGSACAALLPPHCNLKEEDVRSAVGDEGSVVFQTSGSTGKPRLVCHSRVGLLVSARAVNEHLAAKSNDVWLCALPSFHVGGFGIYARAFCSGSSVYALDSKWSSESFVAAIRAQQVSLTSLVPTQVFDLVSQGLSSPSCLRAVLVGGGRLAPALETKARALGWPVLRTYGLTEAGSQVATQLGDQLVLLPHIEAEIGIDRRLKIRGASIADRYLVEDEAGNLNAHRCVDEDGWFKTEDVVDLQGNTLRFIRRDSSHVKILGELVDVEAVEAAILERAGGQKLAVVSVPDRRTEHALVLAFEAGADQRSTDAMIQAYNASVPGPERISRCIKIAEIPRSELGKIQREKLRSFIAEAEK